MTLTDLEEQLPLRPGCSPCSDSGSVLGCHDPLPRLLALAYFSFSSEDPAGHPKLKHPEPASLASR